VFSELVTQLLARLMKHDLIDLHRVAQDGTPIRASAGAASFRSGETLERLLLSARAHLVEVTRAATDPALAADPRRPTPTSSQRSPATKLCPARSQLTRGRRLIDVAVTAGSQSRAARRTVPKL
jgi:hypothetical protein